MPLEYKAGMAGQGRHQGRGGSAVVFDHAFVGKLHTRLHHNGNDPLPCLRQPTGGKGALELRQRLLGVFGGRDGDAVLVFLRAAGDGDFTANDVDRLRRVRMRSLIFREGPFRRGAELCAPAGNDAVRQTGGGVVGSHAHTGVNVDFGEACQHIAPNQLLRVCHGRVFWKILPCQRPQMVAAAQDAVGGHTFFLCQAIQERPEIGGGHAGVAAVLVDLIGRGLHQDDGIVGFRAAQGGADDERIGAAAGVDAFFFCRGSFV